jgi:hypothetical protein
MDGRLPSIPHLRRDNAKPPHISTVSVSVSFSLSSWHTSRKFGNQCPEHVEFNCPLLNTKLVSARATYPRRRAGAHARICTPVNPPPPQATRLQPTSNPQFANPVTIPAPVLPLEIPMYIHISRPYSTLYTLTPFPFPFLQSLPSLAVRTRSRPPPPS